MIKAALQRYQAHEKLVHDSSLKMTKMILIVAIFIWPSWIIFDYFFVTAFFVPLVIVNLSFCLFTALCYVLLKRQIISNLVGQYAIVLPALTSHAFYINIVDANYVFLYFVIGGLMLGMVVYAFMLLPPARAIFFTLYSVCAIGILNVIVDKHTINFILEKGLVIYMAVALFGIALSFAKYRFTVATELKNQIISTQKTKLEINLKETESAYKERNLYLNEMQHRVQNNLQMIYSLIKLQEDYTDEKDPKEILKSLQNKVVSISTIHDLLSTSEIGAAINFSEYIKIICDHYNQDFNLNKRHIIINNNIDIQEIDVSQIFPCGLIINELITNSIKHAFQKREKGVIDVIAHENESFIFLQVIDNGNGQLNTNQSDNGKSSGLGLTLIHGLVAQIEGELTVESTPGEGTRCSIKFKKREKTKANINRRG